MRTDIPRQIKKMLRNYANISFEGELRKELKALSAKFDEWKNHQIDSFELSDAIFQFHKGPSRKLYKKYNDTPLDLIVAHVIVSGLLNREEIPTEVLDYLSNALAFFDRQGVRLGCG